MAVKSAPGKFIADQIFAVPRRIADWSAALGRGKRYVAMFGTGAATNLALAPTNFLPAFYLALPIFVWCLSGAKNRRAAFAIGWWFGFGYFVIGLYWLGSAMLVEASQHAWMIPFATLGLPAFLAVFFGLAAIPTVLGGDHFSRGLILATTLGSVEWLRGHILTGFPWNLLGQAWTGHDSLLQGASVIGVYGLTFAALLSAAFLSVLAMPRTRSVMIVLAVAVAMPAIVALFGIFRLTDAPAVGAQFVPGVGLRLVQAGIPQKEKWQRRYLLRNFQKHLYLSKKNRPNWITHVIWPETATPFSLDQHPKANAAAVTIVPPGGALITGMVRKRRDPTLRVWNSIIALGESGKIVSQYDKFHLVPFGEYVPLQNWLPVKKITAGRIGYTPGDGPVLWRLKGLPPLSPLVCYEVIFPGAVTSDGQRPGWLLVLTNDAWYGKTVGPHQHLALARIRAVEEGLPLVRAANTGISAVFDGFGREWSRLELAQSGVLDTRLPKRSMDSTFYVQYSSLLVVVFLLLTLLTLFFRKGIETPK